MNSQEGARANSKRILSTSEVPTLKHRNSTTEETTRSKPAGGFKFGYPLPEALEVRCFLATRRKSRRDWTYDVSWRLEVTWGEHLSAKQTRRARRDLFARQGDFSERASKENQIKRDNAAARKSVGVPVCTSRRFLRLSTRQIP